MKKIFYKNTNIHKDCKKRNAVMAAPGISLLHIFFFLS